MAAVLRARPVRGVARGSLFGLAGGMIGEF